MLEKSFQQATPSRVPLQYFVTLVSRSAIRVPVPGAIPQSARGRIHVARFRVTVRSDPFLTALDGRGKS
jgi:hypothetical protein